MQVCVVFAWDGLMERRYCDVQGKDNIVRAEEVLLECRNEDRHLSLFSRASPLCQYVEKTYVAGRTKTTIYV